MTATNQLSAVATTDAISELRLARSLGYPKSWHVVRSLIPHPTATDTGTGTGAHLIQDRIFAGDPAENADLYYNHSAAFERAATWKEGESGPWDDEGGQMLPKEAKYRKGTSVQVLFDGKWYNATITKVGEFTDDIRYTVLYTKENEYQNGVTEDEIRLRPKSAASSKAKSKKAAAASGKKSSSSKKRKRHSGDNDDDQEEEGESKKSKGNDSSGKAAAKKEEEVAEPEPEQPEDPLVVFKEFKAEDLAVGTRVLIDYRNTLYKATIRKIRDREGKETDYSVHYDGLKKSKVSWVPFSQVAALLDPDDEAYVVPAPTS